MNKKVKEHEKEEEGKKHREQTQGCAEGDKTRVTDSRLHTAGVLCVIHCLCLDPLLGQLSRRTPRPPCCQKLSSTPFPSLQHLTLFHLIRSPTLPSSLLPPIQHPRLSAHSSSSNSESPVLCSSFTHQLERPFAFVTCL